MIQGLHISTRCDRLSIPYLIVFFSMGIIIVTVDYFINHPQKTTPELTRKSTWAGRGLMDYRYGSHTVFNIDAPVNSHGAY